MKHVGLGNEGVNANVLLSAVSRPVVKMKVHWRGYDCVIQKLRHRDKVAKLKPDYSGNPMPYDYFWVDFNEIGYGVEEMKRKNGQLCCNDLEWLYSLRDSELAALEKLDVARATNDPILQIEALEGLQRVYTDFAFGTWLNFFQSNAYKIDYSYYSDWQTNREIKTLQSEIARIEQTR